MIQIIHTTRTIRRLSLYSNKNGAAPTQQSSVDAPAPIVKPITAIALVKHNCNFFATPKLAMEPMEHYPLEAMASHPP